MAKPRLFRPEDAYRLKTATDPDLSPDGRRVAYVVGETDEENDKLRSSIWVVPADGGGQPRRFSNGPADGSPRWSPDGRWLAFLSAGDDPARDTHLKLAPLDGGTPQKVGDLPGPVSQLAWSSRSDRIAVICRTGLPDQKSQTASDKNAPRRVRGLAAKLDGVGWQDGRRHIFVIEVASGNTSQVTHGAYDHADPAFSPDGSTLAFSSDRTSRRDDRQFRGDIWVMPVSGGKAARLTNGSGRAASPAFSPDGELVAFAGFETDSWDAEIRLYTVAADGSRPPELVAPRADRGTFLLPGMPGPLKWVTDRELAFLVADRGSMTLHTAKLGASRTREIVGGDIQADGFAVHARSKTLVFTGAWPDRPSEVYRAALGTGGSVSAANATQISHLNDAVLDEVVLSPVARNVISRPDGTEVEYFTLLPPDRPTKPVPLHLDVHGGPHGAWPSGRFLAYHQALAAAGYAVVLPNPRGSTGYGQAFTEACTGDWGGADCEDILACCDDVIARGIADPDRMFVSGGSYGGFMTAWIVGHSKRFKAATAMAAVIDQVSLALTTEIPDFALFNMGGTPWEQPDEYTKRSPLTYLPDVDTPVLVLHWEGDIRVPMGQGEELYAGLKVLGKETEMLRYPGGFHIMRTPSQNVDWIRQLLAWNESHDPRRRSARPKPKR